jgi:hypothetical protein
VSRYSAEERAAIFDAMAEALAVTTELASREPEPAEEARWPVRSPLIPTLSTAATDRSIAEERALEFARKTERERQRTADERRREHSLIEKAQSDESWNRWADLKICAALEAYGFNAVQRDALGMFVSEYVGTAIAKLRDELRAEFISARSDKSPVILDLPALPLRRRGDAAYTNPLSG